MALYLPASGLTVSARSLPWQTTTPHPARPETPARLTKPALSVIVSRLVNTATNQVKGVAWESFLLEVVAVRLESDGFLGHAQLVGGVELDLFDDASHVWDDR